MKPVLYAENATVFTTNGLGRLGATECFVEQEVNGMYELSMIVPVDDLRFNEIALSRIILAKPSKNGSPQAFRIYKISKPINGLVEVYAQHISYQLSYIPVMPYTATSCATALSGISTNAAESCPFIFSTNKTISATWKSPDVPTSARSILQGIQGSILQRFKGEYEYDNWNVTLKNRIGTDNGVVIRYGKNLVDLLQEESIEATYTGICPYYKSDDYVLTLTEKVLHSASASSYPFQRTLPVDLTNKFKEIPTEQELRDAGNAYMTENNIGIPKVSLEVQFIPLSDTEEYKNIAPLENVELGDTVGVIFDKLGVQASAEVVYTRYNVLADRYDKIEIGSVKSSFSDTVAKQQEEIQVQRTNFEEAVQTATELINGGLGGYVRTTTNSAGQPQEILVMDTDDTATATNVIRINKNGIGFSTTGYQGPFNSAWTIDGTFDASVINVINLIAEKVNAVNQSETARVVIEEGSIQILRKNNGSEKVLLWLFTGVNPITGNAQGRIQLFDEGGTAVLDANSESGILVNTLPMSFLNSNISLQSGSSISGNAGTTITVGGDIASQNGNANTRAAVIAKRTDTGAEAQLLVGTGGTNHGIYSGSMSKWLLWADGTDVWSNLSVKNLLASPLSSGNQTLTGGQKYRFLLVSGVGASGDPTVSTLIPVSSLTSSNQAFQINDETNFISFYLKTSGSNNVVITYKARSSTGQINNVYGVA